MVMDMKLDVHRAWATNPIVSDAIDRHGGDLTVGALQTILDTMDRFEERFPSLVLADLANPNPDREQLAKTLRAAGVAESDIVAAVGGTPTERNCGPRNERTGLTPADEQIFALADSGMTHSEMIEAFGCRARAAIQASAIRNPMTPKQVEDVLVKDRCTYAEASELRGRSVYTIQNSVLKDRYHRSRGLHAYAEVAS